MLSKAVGFWRGFVAPFGAARQLLGLPRAWPLMLVPVLMFGLVEGIVVAASWRFLKPWAYAKLSGGGSLQQLGATAASWISLLFAGLLGWLLAGLLAPVLSAPALERVVGITEQDLAVPARAPLGFLAEFWCGFRSLLMSSAIAVAIVVALTLLEMVVPPAAVVTTPLKLLLASLGVAWGLFDYPLTLRGIGARARFAFMRRHFSVVLGFGAAFSLVFWLPCFGVAMLPVGVAAATRLYWEIQRAH
jgi:Etoposide-induced protein 2.4 (EI24)